jgi:hypothetical protein
VTNFTFRPLYPQGKSLWYPLDRRLGGPQRRSGCGGEEKNSQSLSGLESPIIQSIAQSYTTELPRLSSKKYNFYQETAPPHFGREVVEYMNAVYQSRCAGRSGPVAWPSRSQDFTPLDFLWDCMQSKVYHTDKTETRQQLKGLGFSRR